MWKGWSWQTATRRFRYQRLTEEMLLFDRFNMVRLHSWLTPSMSLISLYAADNYIAEISTKHPNNWRRNGVLQKHKASWNLMAHSATQFRARCKGTRASSHQMVDFFPISRLIHNLPTSCDKRLQNQSSLGCFGLLCCHMKLCTLSCNPFSLFMVTLDFLTLLYSQGGLVLTSMSTNSTNNNLLTKL